jgi:hypothetical protein
LRLEILLDGFAYLIDSDGRQHGWLKRVETKLLARVGLRKQCRGLYFLKEERRWSGIHQRPLYGSERGVLVILLLCSEFFPSPRSGLIE